jgi:hypothetical protein
MTNSIIPAGRFSVHTSESGAPDANTLLGRPHIPAIIAATEHVSASIRGFFQDPMHPSSARDKLLATWERGLDIHIEGGAQLRALDAASGKFHVHLTPKVMSDEYSLHVALATNGDEKNAVVQDNPHAPAAPIGIYNLDRSDKAMATIERVLLASIRDPKTKGVNLLRAKSILARLNKTQTYLGALKQDRVDHPILAKLEDAAKFAYDSKKLGDENDLKLKTVLSEIKNYVGSHPELRGELTEQIQEEIAVITADQKKWINWRASTGIQTFYVNMG